MSKSLKLLAASACVLGSVTTVSAEKLGLGRPALPEEIAAWDVDISPDASELPDGSGNVEDGEMIFAEKCGVCHGDFAEGVDNWPKLAGGEGTLADKDPVKTVGSYWPYLSTTWDYVHRSMPFGDAQSLSNDEVYAIVAYILYSNDLVEDDFELSKDTFLSVEMPNADGFFEDNRAEVEYAAFSQDACMENCKDSVEITMEATVLDVTPDEGGGDAEAATEEAAAKTEEPAKEQPAEKAEEAPVQTAAADPALLEKGEKVYKKCKACHQVGEGAKNKTGPVLTGVVGAQIGHLEDFKYSKALRAMGEEGKTWDEAALDAFLTKPKNFAKGTKMSFAGLKKEEDRQAVIEYLKSFSQ